MLTAPFVTTPSGSPVPRPFPAPLRIRPDDDDVALVQAFERADIEPEVFDHEAHVRIGWLLMGTLSPCRAIDRFANGLRRYAARQALGGLYHETLTWAYLLLINERLARLPNDHAWVDFRDANVDLLDRRCLERYYRPETLQSEQARRVFVMPDRLALASRPAGTAADA